MPRRKMHRTLERHDRQNGDVVRVSQFLVPIPEPNDGECLSREELEAPRNKSGKTTKVPRNSGFLVANPKFKGWPDIVQLRACYIPKKGKP